MKRFLKIGFGFLLSVLVLSCSKDDGYSLDNFWVASATIYTEGTKPYLVVTDDGDILFPYASQVSFTPKNEQRVWINFTILENFDGEYNYKVRVNDVSEILTKDIISFNSANNDSIGNDPIRIEGLWFAENFLTVQFVYGGGGAIHFINLVRNEDALTTDDGMPILEFRHNRNHDLYNNAMRGWASFNMKSIESEEADSVVFLLKSKPFDGEKPFEKEITYKYKN